MLVKPNVPKVKHVAGLALRKAIIVLIICAVCAILEAHHVFLHIGKAGEFVIGSFADHMLFDVGN